MPRPQPMVVSKLWVKDLIAGAHAEGLTQVQTAARIGVSHAALARWLQAYRLKWYRHERTPAEEAAAVELKKVPATKEWAEELVAWSREHRYSVQQAAKELKMHHNTIMRWLHFHDVPWWRSRRRRTGYRLPTPWQRTEA